MWTIVTKPIKWFDPPTLCLRQIRFKCAQYSHTTLLYASDVDKVPDVYIEIKPRVENNPALNPHARLAHFNGYIKPIFFLITVFDSLAQIIDVGPEYDPNYTRFLYFLIDFKVSNNNFRVKYLRNMVFGRITFCLSVQVD